MYTRYNYSCNFSLILIFSNYDYTYIDDKTSLKGFFYETSNPELDMLVKVNFLCHAFGKYKKGRNYRVFD